MRAELGEYIRRITTVPLPSAPNVPIIDYEVQLVSFGADGRNEPDPISSGLFPPSGLHLRRVAVLAGQSAPDRGGNPQGGVSGRRGSDAGHGPPRSLALHVAGRTQAAGSVWTSRFWKDHDVVQRPQGSA